MKPITLLSIIIIAVLICSSCNGNSESKTFEAIKAAKNKFPDLAILDGKEYELVRSLSIPNPQVQIQLFQLANSPDRLQQMLVISNGNNQFYAIPVPSIRFKNYWNFVYDTSLKKSPNAFPTFETEFNKALDTFKLNAGYHGAEVLNEVFVSVLQARVINKTDSVNLTIKRSGEVLPPDTCLTVDKQNYKAIASSALADSLKYHYRGSVFLTGSKIFNIQYTPLKRSKKIYYKIDIYRQPCIIDAIPIYL